MLVFYCYIACHLCNVASFFFNHFNQHVVSKIHSSVASTIPYIKSEIPLIPILTYT